MWFARYKDEISSIQALVSSLALLVGGAWIVWNFDFQSEHIPQLSTSQEITTNSVGDKITLLRIANEVKNQSRSTGLINCVTLDISRLLPLSNESREIVEKAIQAKEIPENMKLPYLYNVRYREGPKVVPARGGYTWWAYVFVPNYVEGSTERSKLLTVRTQFFRDANCDADKLMEEITLVDMAPK